MKESVFVEFLFTQAEFAHEMAKLDLLGADFEYIKSDIEWDHIPPNAIEYVRISGKINSEVASLIKLQNSALAGKMRISYISDELKDRYRK